MIHIGSRDISNNAPANPADKSAGCVVLAEGDSFGDDDGVLSVAGVSSWAQLINGNVFNYCRDGSQLDVSTNHFVETRSIVKRIGREAAMVAPDVVVVIGGVNDYHLSNHSITPPGVDITDDVKAAVLYMEAVAESHQAQFIISTVAPFKDSVSWSQVEQDWADAYGAWIKETFDNVIDLGSILDIDNDRTIDPQFDLDGLHPNQAGSNAIAAAINAITLC